MYEISRVVKTLSSLLLPLLRFLLRQVLVASAGCVGFSSLVNADVDLYGDVALGLGIQVIKNQPVVNNEEKNNKGAVSQLLKAAVGIQWTQYFSTQLGIRYWTDDLADNDFSDEEDETKPATFTGMSAAWEIALHWPSSYGPYYRYGRHCWTAVFSGLAQPWSEEGCSAIQSIGLTFPAVSRTEADITGYLEYSQTDLEQVASKSLQVGIRMPL